MKLVAACVGQGLDSQHLPRLWTSNLSLYALQSSPHTIPPHRCRRSHRRRLNEPDTHPGQGLVLLLSHSTPYAVHESGKCTWKIAVSNNLSLSLS